MNGGGSDGEGGSGEEGVRDGRWRGGSGGGGRGAAAPGGEGMERAAGSSSRQRLQPALRLKTLRLHPALRLKPLPPPKNHTVLHPIDRTGGRALPCTDSR